MSRQCQEADGILIVYIDTPEHNIFVKFFQIDAADGGCMSMYGEGELSSSGKSMQQTVSTMPYFIIQIVGFCYCLLLKSTMRKNKKLMKGCNDNYS